MKSLIREIHTYVRNILHEPGLNTVPEHVLQRMPGKQYPRMPKHTFPIPEPLTINLQNTLEGRTSNRNSSLAKPITVTELSTLLGHSLRALTPNGRRRYPSGGGLYPVEAYLIAHNIQGLARAVYHYDPENHEVSELWPIPKETSLTHLFRWTEWAAFSSGILVLTAVWQRSAKKYGDFTYPTTLIESGHMGQNVNLVATALGLSVCNIAGFNHSEICDILGLRDDEQALLAIAFGKPADILTQAV